MHTKVACLSLLKEAASLVKEATTLASAAPVLEDVTAEVQPVTVFTVKLAELQELMEQYND